MSGNRTYQSLNLDALTFVPSTELNKTSAIVPLNRNVIQSKMKDDTFPSDLLTIDKPDSPISSVGSADGIDVDDKPNICNVINTRFANVKGKLKHLPSNEVDSLKKEVTSLKEKNAKLKGENETLMRTSNDQQKKLKEYNTTCFNYEQRILDLTTCLDQKSIEVNDLSIEVKDLNHKLLTLLDLVDEKVFGANKN